MQKTETHRRIARWSAVILLAGSLAAGARVAASPAADRRSPQEGEIAQRARNASWIVARERERARERRVEEARAEAGARVARH